MANIIRVIVLLVILFVCFLIMAKHSEESDMVDEHQAIADLDKKLQLDELKQAVRKYQEEQQKKEDDPNQKECQHEEDSE